MTRIGRWSAGLLAALVIGALVVPGRFAAGSVGDRRRPECRLVGPLSSDDAGRFHVLAPTGLAGPVCGSWLAGRLSLAIGVAGSIIAG